MKQVFDTIITVLRNPIYFFDVAVITMWLPKLEFIFKAIGRVFRYLFRFMENH